MTTHRFTGSYVALVTPMDANGAVNFEHLDALIAFHIDAGTHGIVSVGTTGESATLPFEEHIAVVNHTVKKVAGRIPVIAGNGANSTDEAVYLTQCLNDSGVDGYLSVVPYYNKPQQRGMVAHFQAIAAATSLPVLLYNVPGRTVADLNLDSVAVLSKVDNIVGLKDATGDLSRLRAAKSALPADFALFSGDDPTGCQFMCDGGHGVISVTANIVPKVMAKMCSAALNARFDEARELDNSVAELHRDLFLEPNPVMPKYALFKMGLLSSPYLRLPMVEPELNNQQALISTLQRLGIIA